MIRSILATVAGLVIAVSVIAATDWFNHRFYPPPDSVLAAAKQGDFDAIRQAVTEWRPIAPQMALILIPVAWVAGSFWGALAATIINRKRSLIPALIVGSLVLLASVANLRKLPHPTWIAVSGLLGVPLAAGCAWWLIPQATPPSGPRPYDMREKKMAC
jgi:hypothetical protein